MTHTSSTADTLSQFGRMIEFRHTANLWGSRNAFLSRQRPLALANLAMTASSEPVPQGLTLVLTPC